MTEALIIFDINEYCAVLINFQAIFRPQLAKGKSKQNRQLPNLYQTSLFLNHKEPNRVFLHTILTPAP